VDGNFLNPPDLISDHGPKTDDWGKLDMWLDGRTDAIVILGPRKSWLAYEGKSCCSRRYPKHTKEVKYVKSCPHHFRTPSSHWTASTTLSSSISEDRAPSGFDNLNSCRADKSFSGCDNNHNNHNSSRWFNCDVHGTWSSSRV
jgi:hypothetical protein